MNVYWEALAELVLCWPACQLQLFTELSCFEMYIPSATYPTAVPATLKRIWIVPCSELILLPPVLLGSFVDRLVHPPCKGLQYAAEF